MDVKLTNQEILDIVPHIVALQSRENANTLNYALMKIKKRLTIEQKKIQETFDTINDKRIEVCIKYCQKDEKGNPVIENDKYKGLEKGINEEFDKEYIQLENERKSFLEEQVIIKDCHGIHESLIPSRMIGLQLEAITPFIIEEKDKNEVKIN